jgi:Fibronectin type III domain
MRPLASTHRRRRLTTVSVAAGLAGVAIAPLASPIAARAGARIERHPAAQGIVLRPPPPGTLWVSNYGNNSLVSYGPGSSGDVTPVASIVGTRTGLDQPSGIAIDRQGRAWTANYGADTITAYGALANGNTAPTVTIGGAKTGLDLPLGIALTRSGNLWVANGGDSKLLEFANGKHGNVAPTRMIQGPATGITAAAGVAVSVDGAHLWLTDEQRAGVSPEPALEEFSTKARGNAKPQRIITGTKTMLDKPYGIALGLDGDDPVTDDENSASTFRLLRFAPGAHGNAAPQREVFGSLTGLDTPTLIATNAESAIWVPNYLGNIVTRFGPTQVGNVAPIKDIAGADTGLDHPEAIADFILPPSVARAFHAKENATTVSFSWKPPKALGGGLRGYRVRRSLTKFGPWTTVVTTPRTELSTSIKRPASTYYYLVQAFNDAGRSPASAAIKASH